MENVEANGSCDKPGSPAAGSPTMSRRKVRKEADPQMIDRRRFIAFIPGDETDGRMASLETAGQQSAIEQPKRSENIERKTQEGKYFEPDGLRGLLQSDRK
jgi:hypothetical protein